MNLIRLHENAAVIECAKAVTHSQSTILLKHKIQLDFRFNLDKTVYDVCAVGTSYQKSSGKILVFGHFFCCGNTV